jgi:hypothetical protein
MQYESVEEGVKESWHREFSLARFASHMGELACAKWNVITGVAAARWMGVI